MSRKYPQVFDGEWVAPKRRFYKMRCCDCGLVHKMEFRLGPRNQIQLRAWRDNRATAASRRKRK